ncbi:MAG: hypothetical protein Q7S21_03955 [archaeon]|nr:hypothetical protein [archaeon]
MKLIIRGKELILPLTEEQLKQLDSLNGQEIELIKGANDLFILRRKANGIQAMPQLQTHTPIQEHTTIQAQTISANLIESESNPLDEKIFQLIVEKSLGERVEGKFEKLLNKEENDRLKELVKTGKIILFKLNPKYKSAVYKLKEQVQEKKEIINLIKDFSSQQLPEEYSIAKNGFMIVKGDNEAREVSNALRERIEGGEIKGIKGFDGSYYVIEIATYQKIRQALMECFKTKHSLSCEEITKMINVNKELVKTACEFLKDEGEIFEKRKELYILA